MKQQFKHSSKSAQKIQCQNPHKFPSQTLGSKHSNETPKNSIESKSIIQKPQAKPTRSSEKKKNSFQPLEFVFGLRNLQN
jgi:hypothetical protein